jgi:hypothetical protein
MLQIASVGSMPNNKILVISPQSWGPMFVAKHHYAVELTRNGNEVYFLNPPHPSRKRFFSITGAKDYPGLQIIDHAAWFPLSIRFHVRSIYDALMKRHVQWLIKRIGVSFDIVWCFEPNLYSDLGWFKAKKKVYHPVDELFYNFQLDPGKNADLVISVTREILSKFHHVKGKKLFVNHGISREFQKASNNNWINKKEVTIGYSGNLLRLDIDFPTIKKCIEQIPSAKFIFWGNYELNGSNLAGNETAEISDFIQFLKNSPNVQLKGAVNVNNLVKEYEQADIFLICYDIKKDQSRGTNYHKVMEFLSTGKVIVSNNITTYQGSELLRMCESRESNDEFPGLLKETIRQLDVYNNHELQIKRKTFAAQNSYQLHVKTIVEELYK